MKKYEVFIRGENFLLNIDGNAGRSAFYTTRFVEAQMIRSGGERCVFAAQ